jgi:hypothetical protein
MRPQLMSVTGAGHQFFLKGNEALDSKPASDWAVIETSSQDWRAEIERQAKQTGC